VTSHGGQQIFQLALNGLVRAALRADSLVS
jgi:hypothetical protein